MKDRSRVSLAVAMCAALAFLPISSGARAADEPVSRVSTTGPGASKSNTDDGGKVVGINQAAELERPHRAPCACRPLIAPTP